MRSIHLLGVTALGLLAADSARAQGCPCETFESEVKVTISVGEGNAVKVDRPRICLKAGGTVEWVAADGESFAVQFDKNDGTPFPQARLQGDRQRPVRVRATRRNGVRCGRMFRYSVLVRAAGRDLTLDPEIIVEND